MNGEITISKISDFLERYKSFSRTYSDQRLAEYTYRFNHIKSALSVIKSIAEDINRWNGSSFNIFKLLKVDRYEVSTHSAILANLLNPDGSHGQGFLFLDAFLKHCSKNWPMPQTLHSSGYSWNVETEKSTAFGRLDIVLTCPEQDYVLAIENKIDADEQEDQLVRYSDWLKSSFATRNYMSDLIFLTPTGHESLTAKGCMYHRMSYCTDIRDWLENVAGRICAPKIRETVYQYIEVITTL